MKTQILTLLFTAQSVLSSVIPEVIERATCAPIHIIAARASTEAPGPGVIGSLATLIQNDHAGTDLESVNYPATLDNYASSSAQGTAALTSQLTNYTTACPDAKVVLLGYSQGAHILLDTLCGGGGGALLGPETPAIDQSIGDHVVAIIQMGDPRHLINKPYDVGTSINNGLFPRLADQLCDHYASRIQAYCDFGDTFCDSGADVLAHLDYTTKYNTNALAFVNKLLD